MLKGVKVNEIKSLFENVIIISNKTDFNFSKMYYSRPGHQIQLSDRFQRVYESH